MLGVQESLGLFQVHGIHRQRCSELFSTSIMKDVSIKFSMRPPSSYLCYLNNCKIPPESGVETTISLYFHSHSGPFHIERLAIFMICSLQPNGRNVWVWDHYSPALAITELISNFPNPDAVGAQLSLSWRNVRPSRSRRFDERLSPSDISSLFGCDELKP